MPNAISTPAKAPSVWKQLLHQTPSTGDVVLHGISLAANIGIVGYSAYKMATDKHMSTSSEIGYALGLALCVPLAAFDVQRLIFNHQIKQRNPETIQKALDVLNHKRSVENLPALTHSKYHPFGPPPPPIVGRIA